MVQLKPGAEDVARLLIDMSRGPWFTTEADRRRFFEEFGVHDAGHVDLHGSPESRSCRITTSLPGDFGGICTMFRDEFLAVSFFCYNETGDDGPQARAGFTGIERHLTRTLGEPSEQWGSEREPACLWHVGPLDLDLYCFQRGASGIMVGLAHAGRSAAADDAARS